MGEIVKFPNTDFIIYDLDPEKDSSWDMIIDAVYRDGQAIYQYDGKYYTLTVEDLTGPQAA